MCVQAHGPAQTAPISRCFSAGPQYVPRLQPSPIVLTKRCTSSGSDVHSIKYSATNNRLVTPTSHRVRTLRSAGGIPPTSARVHAGGTAARGASSVSGRYGQDSAHARERHGFLGSCSHRAGTLHVVHARHGLWRRSGGALRSRAAGNGSAGVACMDALVALAIERRRIRVRAPG